MCSTTIFSYYISLGGYLNSEKRDDLTFQLNTMLQEMTQLQEVIFDLFEKQDVAMKELHERISKPK